MRAEVFSWIFSIAVCYVMMIGSFFVGARFGLEPWIVASSNGFWFAMIGVVTWVLNRDCRRYERENKQKGLDNE